MRPKAAWALALSLAACGKAQSPSGSLPVSGIAGAEPREAEAVVLTGRRLPAWSQRAASGLPAPYPSGTPASGIRDAHNGTLLYPAAGFAGDPAAAPVEEIAAFRWSGTRFEEIPVQVDERYVYFLANANSSFSVYSGTDLELTYAWDTESWKKTAGRCEAEYAPGDGAMPDPVPRLDDDDEIVFMARDAGSAAPADARPEGAVGEGYAVALATPGGGEARLVYLYRRAQGSSFAGREHYVSYRRDRDADQWIDRNFFREDDPAKLGISNTGYGANLAGSVCPSSARDGEEFQWEAAACARGAASCDSTDRFVRDGVSVQTPTYQWRATGRWMIRELRIGEAGKSGRYGDDLIDRWKGRAFQQSPDSDISLVGFEDEQVNWEANSSTLGERRGPVRAIREIWGADSGTNVTKVETFYRDYIQYRYRVRVHPIPPDGLYTSWDYNRDAVQTYYTPLRPAGVAVDGQNDDIGNIEQILGLNFFVDLSDPTFNLPLTYLTWTQVGGRGRNGSIVSQWQVTGLSTLANPLALPYYRDDACFDDGTGDDPVPRPFPGERSSDERVVQGYAEIAAQNGRSYDPDDCTQRSGVHAADGLHLLVSLESDNLFTGLPLDVSDIVQWQFLVPQEAPANVGAQWAEIVRRPVQPGIAARP